MFLSLISLSQNTYYVQNYVNNANASDMNMGTDINFPWATWQRAFNTAEPGDTVYFREGTWYAKEDEVIRLNPDSGNGNYGTYSDPIHFFNFPGEKPILDCTNHTNTGSSFDVRNTVNIKFRGLTVQNQKQSLRNQWVASMVFQNNKNLSLDQIVCRDGGGYGIWILGFDTLHVINCDSYNHFDENDDDPGNTADGFMIGSGTITPDSSNVMYFHGNRAWGNSDDAFELSPACQVYIYNNWAFCNGNRAGLNKGGGGFKLKHGYQRVDKRHIYNNLVAFCEGSGFAEVNLHELLLGPVMSFSNNTVYKCEIGFSRGFGGFDPEKSGSITLDIFKNNLVYNSEIGENFDQIYLAGSGNPPINVLQTNNTWQFKNKLPWWEYNDTVKWAYTNKEDQFLKLPNDSAQCMAILGVIRNQDGSLPDLNGYFDLSATSELIDAGIDIGLGFNGTGPDIGAFECPTVPDGTNKYPLVEIVSPPDKTKLLKGNIKIDVITIDPDGSIAKVEFYYNDTIKIGEDDEFPWSLSWDNAPIGKSSIRVKAIDNRGASATSRRINITVRPNFKSFENSNEAIIFPNPVNDYFNIFLSEPLKRTTNVKILSYNGTEVYSGKMMSEEITKQFDIIGLKPGLYVLMLYASNILLTIKFIKL